MVERRYLTPTEVGAMIGVDAATIRRYIAAGVIHAVRVGKRRLFIDVDEVNRLVGHGEKEKEVQRS